MQQLPLPVGLRTSSVFATFVAGDNAVAVDQFRQRQFTTSPVVFLYGPQGTGKTHLLQALCADASFNQSVGYFGSQDFRRFGVELLAGCGRYAFLCLDDSEVLFANSDWNGALFSAYREAEESGSKLIFAARSAPASLSVALQDLRSRLLAGTVLRLVPLPESQQREALLLHAAQRGLALPVEVIEYLQTRLPRDMRTLCGVLDQLDAASLAAQRKITLPFVRQLIAHAP